MAIGHLLDTFRAPPGLGPRPLGWSRPASVGLAQLGVMDTTHITTHTKIDAWLARLEGEGHHCHRTFREFLGLAGLENSGITPRRYRRTGATLIARGMGVAAAAHLGHTSTQPSTRASTATP